MKNNKDYIVNGPLYKSIIRFSVPIMIGLLIQNLFHSADMIVLGNMADSVAVASVGATSNITALVINSFIGLSTGTSILLARSVGASDDRRTKRIVDTSIYFSAAVGILLAVVGSFVSIPLLALLKCPSDCFDGASTYLRIYMLGAPAILIYNFGSAIIRAEGDSRRPLVYVIISGLTNIILNLILCFVMTNKVSAVAIATVASQVVGAVLVILRLVKKDGACSFTFKKPSFSFHELKLLLKFSIPATLTSAMYPIATLQITPALNSFGSAAIAGSSAASNIEAITNAPYGAVANSLVTFVSQNMGASKSDRVRRTVAECLLTAVVCGLIGLFLYLFLGEELLSLYVPGDAAAISFGLTRMKLVLAFQAVAAANQVFASALQAFGYPTYSSLNSIISVLIFRIFWMNVIYPLAPGYELLIFCFTCSWIFNLILNICIFLPVYIKYCKRTRIKA